MKVKKQKSQTLTSYKKWKALKKTLYVSKFALPCVPATIITGINWNEWFVESGTSLPLGFATLLIALISTILAIMQKDEIVKKKISPLFFIAIVMAIWAISFMFLANIMQNIGQMLLWTCLGIVAGASANQVETTIVNDRVIEYEELIADNKLDKKAKNKERRAEIARAEAEAIEEARKRATE